MENTQKKKIAVAFNPLDLQFKPKPKKKDENIVKITVAEVPLPKKKTIAIEKKGEGEEGEEKGDEGEEKGEEGEEEEGIKKPSDENKPPKVEVIDKRGDANINRRFILENLQKYNFAAQATEEPSIAKKSETIAASIATAEAASAENIPPPPPPQPTKKTIKIVKKGKTVPIGDDEKAAAAAAAPEAAPPKRGRKTAAPPKFATVTDIRKVVIGDTIMEDRLPEKKEPVIHRIPKYYMNNRKLFLQSINGLLQPYKNDLDNIDNEGELRCDRNPNENFGLLTHQKVIRDYLNLYTP